MKVFAIAAAAFTFFMLMICGGCVHIDPSEKAFQYNIISGKPVSAENNPLLPQGFDFAWGWNEQYFVVNGEINAYTFTSTKTPESPFDESLTWDSKEGVTMHAGYTIEGRVTDPWEFYAHYGHIDYKYNEVDHGLDPRIYEALRQAGQYVDKKMGELTTTNSAVDIRLRPTYYAKILTEMSREYMEKFGFTVRTVMFPEPLKTKGSTIDTNRQKLAELQSEINSLREEVKNAKGERTTKIAQAVIQSNLVVQVALREANDIRLETRAVAEQLKTSIELIGIEATMRVEAARMMGSLMKSGTLGEAFITSESIFGEVLYPDKKKN